MNISKQAESKYTMIEYIILFALGFWIGSKVQAIKSQIIFKMILDELGVTKKQMIAVAEKHGQTIDPEDDDSETAEELPVVAIKIEKHNDNLYVFRKDNDQFLGQGKDLESLIDRLGEKLKNVRLVASKEDGADLLNGHYDVYNGKMKRREP